MNRSRHLPLFVLLTLVLLLLMAGPALAAWPDLTADILDDYTVSEDQVEGISDGFADATWRPYAQITRAQFVKMAMDAFGIPPMTPPEPTYADVHGVDQYFGVVEGANAAGLIEGYADGSFRPYAQITREQGAAIIARYLAMNAQMDLASFYTAAEITAIFGPFADDGQISTPLLAEMAYAVEKGVIRGTASEMLNPRQGLFRIQGAAMLIRAAQMDGGEQVVEIIEGYVPETLALPHLGDMSFMIDPSVPAATATANWDEETVLRLTDAGGLEWELKVPKGAVLRSTDITMKALKDLESSIIPGTLVGGVLFEPDGLHLAAPATLTVRGTNLGSRTLMLTGRHDGSDVDFAGTQSVSGALSASIFHFSTAAATEARMEQEWEDMKAEARAQAAALLEEAETLNNKPIRFPPPPSVPLECPGDEAENKLNDAAINKWVKDALAPEKDLETRLLTVAADMQLMGLDYDEYQPLQLAALNLSVRGLWKGEKLLDTYPNDRDKILPITVFVASALAEYQLLGGDDQSLFVELAYWVRAFIDPMISDIRNQHDYRLVRPVLTVAGMAALRGADVDIQDVVDKVEAAMRFKLETRLSLKLGTSDWLLEGETYLDEFQTSERGLLTARAILPVRYVSYTDDDTSMTTYPTFTANVVVDEFDPCGGTARLLVDRYWADEEYYTLHFPEGDYANPEPYMLVGFAWPILFGEPLDGGWYEFPLTLRNLEVEAVDELIQRENQEILSDARFEIRLIHEPR